MLNEKHHADVEERERERERHEYDNNLRSSDDKKNRTSQCGLDSLSLWWHFQQSVAKTNKKKLLN